MTYVLDPRPFNGTLEYFAYRKRGVVYVLPFSGDHAGLDRWQAALGHINVRGPFSASSGDIAQQIATRKFKENDEAIASSRRRRR